MSSFHVDLWNVNQGDASSVLVERSPNEYVLDVIDTGPALNNQFLDWVASNVSRKIRIRNLIFTHNDADHVGAALSILDLPHVTLEKFHYLQDRNAKDLSKHVRKTLTAIQKLIPEQRFLLNADCHHHVIDKIGDSHELELVYPDISEDWIHASGVNQYSAIIQLNYLNEDRKVPLILWGADNLLETISKHCSHSPFLLFGPHHGSPEDSEDRFDSFIKKISPRQCFLSFASVNRYNHPKVRYIKSLCGNRCHPICVQKAKKCASGCSSPVFDGDARYGMSCPSDGNVSCHGHLRLLIDGPNIRDEFQEEYANAINNVGGTLCKKYLPQASCKD